MKKRYIFIVIAVVFSSHFCFADGMYPQEHYYGIPSATVTSPGSVVKSPSAEKTSVPNSTPATTQTSAGDSPYATFQYCTGSNLTDCQQMSIQSEWAQNIEQIQNGDDTRLNDLENRILVLEEHSNGFFILDIFFLISLVYIAVKRN